MNRPILFSDQMVRAILDGSKTQTRRIVKCQSLNNESGAGHENKPSQWSTGRINDSTGEFESLDEMPCPYGIQGDHLWIKETFWSDTREPKGLVIYDTQRSDGLLEARYKDRNETEACDAELNIAYLQKHNFWRKKPSIFMPRWASRITLEIVSVRVERLNDISEDDAMAEGMARDDAIHDYAALWDSINGSGSFASNPWVWKIVFRRIKP